MKIKIYMSNIDFINNGEYNSIDRDYIYSLIDNGIIESDEDLIQILIDDYSINYNKAAEISSTITTAFNINF